MKSPHRLPTGRWYKSILACSLIALAGCSSSYPELPTATLRASVTTNPEAYNYLIGPGDQLDIFVWRNPDISGSFTVRPDGKISTRLVEDVPVSGKTPTQLAREMEEILSLYLRDPIVTVSVGGFEGPFSEQVRIIGEAEEPQAINYRQYMSLLDVMIEVDGLTDFADGNHSTLVRIEDGLQKQYTVRLDDLMRDGDISANVDILPGDILIIPEAWF